MEQQPSLFKNSRFILLFLGSFLAIIGFSMFFMTTTWFVISDLGSASSLGIILIAITVPRILMMAFGGVLADKFKKTTIMFSTSFIQGVLLIIIFVLNHANQLTFEYLIILGFFFGILDAFSGPAGTSLIPKMVEKNQIKQANAVIQGLGQIGFIVGPMISGSVMEYAGVTTGYLVSAIIVLLSAFFMFPPFLKEGPVDNTVKQTPLEAALGVGMLVSTAIIGIVKIRRRGLTSIAGLIATLFVAFAFSQIPNLYILTALAFLIGFTMTFVSIPFFTSAQEDTDPRIMGRVMSIVFLAMNGFDPLAYASVTLLVARGIDVQHVILSFSIVGLIIALITLWKGRTYRKYTSNY
ncbi:MFS transporter [Shouchella clausii]|uniref:MFS transporter n=1 Tax=Shouchella clausii TaxID=79880 RepID=UPI0031FC293A